MPAAALIPYILPAVLGGALGSMNARNKDGKGARFKGFLQGAAIGAGTAFGAKKAGINPFKMFGESGAPVPGGELPFNPMSFINQDTNRIEPEPVQPQMQPLIPPAYLPPINFS